MVYRDFRGAAGKDVSQDRNKGAALLAMQHGIDDVTAISAEHAAIIAHGFTGRALNQMVDHP